MPSRLGRAGALVRWALTMAALAPTRRAGAWLFAVALLMPVKRRLGPLRDRPLRVRVGPAPGRPFWFSDRSELLALEEVFARGEYALELARPPAVIVDLGANAGQASLYFRMRYPEARIVAVEPDPRTFRRLERNLGDDPNVVLRRYAITERPGRVALTRFLDASWKTRVASREEGDGAAVRGATIDELFAEEGLEHVDLMKVDIEGLELDVLSSSAAVLSVGTVIGELHYWELDVPRDEALAAMRERGRFPHAVFVDHHVFVLSREERQLPR